MLSLHFKESIILLDKRYQNQNDKIAMGYPLGPKLVRKFFVFFNLSATWFAHDKLFASVEGTVSLI